MRNKQMSTRSFIAALAASLLVLLSACNLGKAQPTPTPGLEAIYTSAAQTIAAQQATMKALTPSPRATKTTFPTLSNPTTLASVQPFGSTTPSSGGGGCDNSIFAADVTIPDGTQMEPGKQFVKTWTLMNNGTCAWSTAYKLVFLDGEKMNGADALVPQNVPAGQQINLSVNLTAPTAPGDYTGRWEMENAAGLRFGNIITVVIKVGNGAAGTPGETGTPGTPTVTATPSITPTH